MAQMVRFVDKPGGSVLLDVTPGTGGVVLGANGPSIPPPPINRSVVSNPVRDGGSVASAPYGLRTITLPLAYAAGPVAPQAARRTAVNALMRVLARERVWLEVRPDTITESRYLYCYKPDAELVAKLQGLGDEWAELNLELLADPFAYGPKESLGTLSFTQANNLKVTVAASTIKGDVPAPMVCTITSPADSLAYSVYVATRRGGGVHSTLVDLNSAGGTLPGSSTRTTVADAINSVGGSRVQWGNVANGATYQINTPVLVSNAGAGSVKLRGTYRVLLLADSSVSTSTDIWEADLRLASPGGWVFLASEVKIGQVATLTAESPSTSTNTWADMGLVEVPFGGRPLAGSFDADVTVGPMTVLLYLTARSIAAPGEISTDALVVLPADDELMLVQYASTGASRTFIVDPHSGQIAVRQAGVNIPDVARVNYQGAPPMVCPDVDVDVYSIRLQGGMGGQHVTTKLVYDHSFDAEYWPRYLTVV